MSYIVSFTPLNPFHHGFGRAFVGDEDPRAARPHDRYDRFGLAGAAGDGDDVFMVLNIFQRNADIIIAVQDAPVDAAVAAQRFAAGSQGLQGLPLMARHSSLLSHLIGPADTKHDDLGLGRQGHVFPRLGVGLEHDPQGRLADTFGQVDHAVRAMRPGGDAGGDVVGLKLDVIAHAAPGRQDRDAGLCGCAYSRLCRGGYL